MADDRNVWTEHQIEQILGNLLRAGVALAAGIVLFGGTIYLIRHGSEPAEHSVFHGEPSDLCTPNGIVTEAMKLRGRAVIQLGLLALIGTPVLRVMFSVYAFRKQRDLKYVVITLIVLATLLFSLLSGQTG